MPAEIVDVEGVEGKTVHFKGIEDAAAPGKNHERKFKKVLSKAFLSSGMPVTFKVSDRCYILYSALFLKTCLEAINLRQA